MDEIIFRDHQHVDINNAVIYGNNNFICGNNNSIIGNNNHIRGDNTTTTGDHNMHYGDCGTIVGNSNIIIGRSNNITGDNNQIRGANNTLISGNYNTGAYFRGRSPNYQRNDNSIRNIFNRTDQNRRIPNIIREPENIEPQYQNDLDRANFLLNLSAEEFNDMGVMPNRPLRLPRYDRPIQPRRNREQMRNTFALGDLRRVRLEEKEDTKPEVEKDTCIICYENKKSVIFLPCAHINTCNGCSRAIIDTNSKCPVCRDEVTEMKNVII